MNRTNMITSYFIFIIRYHKYRTSAIVDVGSRLESLSRRVRERRESAPLPELMLTTLEHVFLNKIQNSIQINLSSSRNSGQKFLHFKC